MDLYTELGVSRNATQEELHEAYRRIARQTHPDIGGNPEAFQRVAQAWFILKDPDRRAHYDATGENSHDPAEAQAHIGLLCGMVGELIAKHPRPWTLDIPGAVREELKRRMIQLLDHKRAIGAEQKKLNKLLGRFTRKSGGSNFFEQIVIDKLKAVDTALANADKEMMVLERASKTLDDFDFTHESEPPNQHNPYANQPQHWMR